MGIGGDGDRGRGRGEVGDSRKIFTLDFYRQNRLNRLNSLHCFIAELPYKSRIVREKEAVESL